MLIAGAVLASHGSLNIYWLLLVAWAGAVNGDGIGYLVDAKGGNKLLTRYGGRIGITEERFQKVEAFFRSATATSSSCSRQFFVILRQFNGIVAGTAGKYVRPRFFIYNAIGSALWVGFWGGATLARPALLRVSTFFRLERTPGAGAYRAGRGRARRQALVGVALAARQRPCRNRRQSLGEKK